MTHSFALHVPDAALEPEPLDPEQIVSGTPEVTGKVVWESADGRQIRGIWQITPGVVTDTEADELFVVLKGSELLMLDRTQGTVRRPSRSRAGPRCGSGPATCPS